jgi:hypothetical protein
VRLSEEGVDRLFELLPALRSSLENTLRTLLIHDSPRLRAGALATIPCIARTTASN